MIDLRENLESMKRTVRSIPLVESVKEIKKDIKERDLTVAVYLYVDAARKIHIKDEVSGYHTMTTGENLDVIRMECGMTYLRVNTGMPVKIPFNRLYILMLTENDNHIITDALFNYAGWWVE